VTTSPAALELKESIKRCRACGLHEIGGGPVPFDGDPSDIMILGEAPGRREDERGVPFCGPAGNLLWQELEKVGIRQDTVLTANTVSCFPDRTPNDDEVDTCRRNLVAQIRFCNPLYILALGRVANQSLGRSKPLAQYHGEWYEARLPPARHLVRVFPTYHPSAILRNGTLTRCWRGDLRAFASVALHGET
jgi:DNA polymerase